MITIEEKLNAFNKVVLEKSQNEYQKKLEGINEENNRRVNEYKEELKKRSQKIVDDMTSKGELEKNRLISKAKMEKKRSILSKKEELIKKSIGNIIKITEQFTYKEEYQKYMKNSIINVFAAFKEKESIVLYIREEDMKNTQSYIYEEAKKIGLSQNQVKLLPSQENIIGGIIATDQNGTIKIDYSLKTLIKDNKSMIGAKLNEALEGDKRSS